MTIARSDWHAAGWARLPHHREDLSQRNRHPLTIQYAGDPAVLAAALAASGWAPALVLDWENAMRLLSPSLPLADLPVVPQVHDRRYEVLVLTRPAGTDKREVLRLWPSRFRLDDGSPLWVGNVSRQRKDVLFDLVVLPATIAHEFDLPPELAAGTPGLATGSAPGTGIVLIESGIEPSAAGE